MKTKTKTKTKQKTLIFWKHTSEEFLIDLLTFVIRLIFAANIGRKIELLAKWELFQIQNKSKGLFSGQATIMFTRLICYAFLRKWQLNELVHWLEISFFIKCFHCCFREKSAINNQWDCMCQAARIGIRWKLFNFFLQLDHMCLTLE